MFNMFQIVTKVDVVWCTAILVKTFIVIMHELIKFNRNYKILFLLLLNLFMQYIRVELCNSLHLRCYKHIFP